MTAAVLALALTLLVGLWLTRPLWRTGRARAIDREGANVQAFHSRKAEIQRELDAGLIDAETADAMARELEAGLIGSAQPEAVREDATRSVRSARLGLAMGLGLICALAAVVLYGLAGSWRIANWVDLSHRDPKTARALAIADDMGRLEKRLASHPDDLDAAGALAQYYLAQDRPADAIPLLAEVNAKGGENPDWLVAEGEARLAVSAPDQPDPLARARFDQAATLAPGHPRAQWYAGLSALQAGDFAAARDHWRALLALDVPDSVRDVLETRVAEIEARIGPSDAGPTPGGGAGAAGAADIRIELAVQLTDGLSAQVRDGDTLFVFAQIPDGPPMPLAVYRGLASELPARIVLDDSLAMTPAARISQHDRWQVTARISHSGQAQPASGDLQGARVIGRAELGGPIDLVIDTQLP